MSWSYSSDPSSSDRDWVRWKLGLTDDTRQIVQDEEIDAELADNSNRYFAAAEVADAVAGLFSRDVDFDYDDIAETASQAKEHYEGLADRMREKGQELYGAPEPIFESQRQGIGGSDEDPLFSIGEMNN